MTALTERIGRPSVSPYVAAGVMNPQPTGEQSQHLAEPQLPELGIERIVGASHAMSITTGELPWIQHNSIVSLSTIHFVGGTSVFYGSLVSGNHTLRKLADLVCPERGKQVQTALFTSMPGWLDNRDMPAISRVMSAAGELDLYKAARGRCDPARLFFGRTSLNGLPVILKVAIARHKDQGKVAGILTTQGHHGRFPQHYRG